MVPNSEVSLWPLKCFKVLSKYDTQLFARSVGRCGRGVHD